MRHILKVSVLGVALLLSAGTFAQQKIGHINSEELFKLMPETDSAQAKMQAVINEVQSVAKAMETEYQNKVQEYQANQAQYSDLIKSAKVKEIQDLQARIEDFQQQAQENLQDQRTKLFTPVMDKAKKAIQDVAKENKYAYILDLSNGVVLYAVDTEDILPLVKQKLGLKK